MRIGAVTYLNTKPLIEYWQAPVEILPPAGHGGSADLVLDLPSRLADRLRCGDLDLALIPAVEVFQQPELLIVPDACIACWGPVWSVKLLSRVPFAEMRTLALDEGSRTSVVLCRLLLWHLHRVEPQLSPLGIDQPWADTAADAVLVIGDRAMRAQDPRFTHVWDLGQVWREWTGLPFVFAVWAAHERLLESDPAGLRAAQRALNRARDLGSARLDELSQRYAAPYGLSHRECMKYLTEHLHFQYGQRQRRALHEFYRLATEACLVPPQRELLYHECT
jgi:chorismate dehydratase